MIKRGRPVSPVRKAMDESAAEGGTWVTVNVPPGQSAGRIKANLYMMGTRAGYSLRFYPEPPRGALFFRALPKPPLPDAP